ncbi:MAG: hypothetical protein IJ190_03545 [Prevotella sp.]|nr:hypothetical protein [Prevotella sp.]
MDLEQFGRQLAAHRDEVEHAMRRTLPVKVGRIAKDHFQDNFRKGATGDVLLTFRGEFTRFENPEDNRLGRRKQGDNGGEILGCRVNGEQSDGQVDQSPFDNYDNSGPLPF